MHHRCVRERFCCHLACSAADDQKSAGAGSCLRNEVSWLVSAETRSGSCWSLSGCSACARRGGHAKLQPTCAACSANSSPTTSASPETCILCSSQLSYQLQRHQEARLREAHEGVQPHDRSIQNRKQQNGDAGEDDIVHRGRDVVHQGLAGEAAVELVEEEHEAEGDVLVEGVLDEAGQAVRGQAAVHQQQAGEKPAEPWVRSAPQGVHYRKATTRGMISCTIAARLCAYTSSTRLQDLGCSQHVTWHSSKQRAKMTSLAQRMKAVVHS